MDRKRRSAGPADGNPNLNFVVPGPLRFLNPLLRLIPRSTLLSNLFDATASLYAPRGPIVQLQRAGYVDSFRRIHPHAFGFTCPAASPAGRIDFIFASPMIADRLEACDAVVGGESLLGSAASDHLAVAASFAPAAKQAQGVDNAHALSTP